MNNDLSLSVSTKEEFIMPIVNIYDTHLSKLIDFVIHGEEVIVMKRGGAIAKLISFCAKKPKRRFGGLKGKVHITHDFDTPLPQDVLTSFEK